MIRPSTTSDHNFIVDSWVRSYEASSTAASMARGVYRAHWSALVHHLVTLCPATVMCDDLDPSIIIGYGVHQGPTLHYLFVREDFRRLGYGAEIVRAITPAITQYTHRTTLWQQIRPRWASTWTYTPGFALFPEIIRSHREARLKQQ